MKDKNYRLSIRIALRYLFAPKSHNAVNVISAIAMAGVAVAAMAMVCIMSVFNGFSDLASARLSIIDPELRLSPREGKVIENADSVIAELSSIPQIANALPVIQEQALAVYGDVQLPVTIKGVPPEYNRASSIDKAIIDGEFRSPDNLGDYATLSVGASIRLGARPSQYEPLAIHVPKRMGRYNPANPMASFRSDSLLVSGVYEIDQPEYDKDFIIIPIEAARRLLDYTTHASSIEVSLRYGTNAQDAKDIIRQAIGDRFMISDRQEQQQESFRMINIEKWVTLLMLAFILVIASFNIISTLSMLIIEKRESTAIMRSLGANDGLVKRIFFFEGWMISVTGGIIGIIIGVALVLAQQWGGFIKLGGDASQMSIHEYPVRLAIPDLAIILAIITAIGFVTGAIALMRRQR